MHRYGTRGTKKTEGEGNVARTKPTAPKPPAPKAAAAPKKAKTISASEFCAREFDDGYGDDSSVAGDDAAAECLEEEASDAEASDASALDDPRASAAAKKKVEAAAKALEKRTKGCAVVVKCMMARGGTTAWTLAPLDPPRTRAIPPTCVVLDEQSGVRSVGLEDLMKAAGVAGDTLGLVGGTTKKALHLKRVRVVGRSADLVELDRKEGKVVWVAELLTAAAAFVDETGLSGAGAVAAPTLAVALAPKPAAKTGEVKRAERKEAADWVLAFVALSDSERWAAAGLPSIDAAAAFRIREVLEKGDVRADAFEDLLERDVATGVYVLRPGAPLPTVADLAAFGIKAGATKKKKGAGSASHAADQMSTLATAIVEAQAQAQQQAPGGAPPFHPVAPPGYPPRAALRGPTAATATARRWATRPRTTPTRRRRRRTAAAGRRRGRAAGRAGRGARHAGADRGDRDAGAAAADAAAGAPPAACRPTAARTRTRRRSPGRPGATASARRRATARSRRRRGRSWATSRRGARGRPRRTPARRRPTSAPRRLDRRRRPRPRPRRRLRPSPLRRCRGATTTPAARPPRPTARRLRRRRGARASPGWRRRRNVAAAQSPPSGRSSRPGRARAGAENTAPPATPGARPWPAAPYSAATTPSPSRRHYHGSSRHYPAGGAPPARAAGRGAASGGADRRRRGRGCRRRRRLGAAGRGRRRRRRSLPPQGRRGEPKGPPAATSARPSLT